MNDTKLNMVCSIVERRLEAMESLLESGKGYILDVNGNLVHGMDEWYTEKLQGEIDRIRKCVYEMTSINLKEADRNL